MKSLKKFTLTLIILITLLSTGYVKAMYLWSVDVKSGQAKCEGAGFEYEWGASGNNIAMFSPINEEILAYSSIGKPVIKKIDGTIVRLLSDYEYLSLSSDGQKLVGVHWARSEEEKGKRLAIISVKGLIERHIPIKFVEDPAKWSPNEEWIACQTHDIKDYKILSLDVVNPDSGKRRTLLAPQTISGLIHGIEWAPDSKLLAVTLSKSSPELSQALADGDWSKLTELAKQRSEQLKVINVENARVVFTADSINSSIPPQWSSEGSRVAYIREKSPSLLVTDIDKDQTKEVAPLYDSYDAYIRWSPDGEHIAVMDEEGSDKAVIFVVDVENESKMKFGFTGGVEYLVGWSSDGQKIYYLSERSPFHFPASENVTGLLDMALRLYRDDRYEETAELVGTANLSYAMRYGSPKESVKLYRWNDDFPSLIAQMKELYRGGDEDFYWASFKARGLLETALELKLDRGEKVGYLEEELPTPASSEDMFSQSIEKEIREFAKREYPNDSQMQQYIYDKQMSAYRYMLNVTDSEVKKIATREYPNDYTMQKYVYDNQLSAKRYSNTMEDEEVKRIALREYPNDHSMQKYVYDKQLSAKRYMKGVKDSEVKRIATREYPNDYSMQKYTYDKQLSAKQYMHRVSNSNAKSKAQREYPNDYSMQKYTYDKIISR